MSRKKTILTYLGFTLFLFIFQFVYHKFSHGVISQELKFIWLIPLAGGIIAFVADLLFHFLSMRMAVNCYNTALAVLANELLLNSILYIAGSDSPHLMIYPLTSMAFGVLTIVFFFYYRVRKAKAGD